MIALIAVLSAALAAASDAPTKQQDHPNGGDSAVVAILMTGQNRGIYEPCGCRAMFRGGLVRRATAFQRYRSQYPSVVAIDTGDQVPQFSVAEEFGPRREIRDRTDAAIMQGMQALRYDAVLVGDLDLDWGLQRYRKLTRDLPMIAANLSDNEGRLGGKTRIVETPAARVGIIGVVHPEAFALLRPEIRARLRITDPIAAARKAADDLRKNCDLIVAVTVGSDELDAELASAVPDIDVIVSQFGHHPDAAADASDTPIRVVSPRNGLEVALLELTLDADKHVTSHRVETLEIEPSIPREPHLEELLSALNYDVNRLTLLDEHGVQPSTIVPADKCRDCHTTQYDFWNAHRHAAAMDTLADAGRADDKLCVGCHTTGFGNVGGFVDLAVTPQLAGVSCTACHVVDLAAHRLDDRLKLPPVADGTCTVCHTREDSPQFEKERDKYMAAGRCPPTPAASESR